MPQYSAVDLPPLKRVRRGATQGLLPHSRDLEYRPKIVATVVAPQSCLLANAGSR